MGVLKKTNFRILCVPVGIKSECLQNRSQERYDGAEASAPVKEPTKLHGVASRGPTF